MARNSLSWKTKSPDSGSGREFSIRLRPHLLISAARRGPGGPLLHLIELHRREPGYWLGLALLQTGLALGFLACLRLRGMAWLLPIPVGLLVTTAFASAHAICAGDLEPGFRRHPGESILRGCLAFQSGVWALVNGLLGLGHGLLVYYFCLDLLSQAPAAAMNPEVISRLPGGVPAPLLTAALHLTLSLASASVILPLAARIALGSLWQVPASFLVEATEGKQAQGSFQEDEYVFALRRLGDQLMGVGLHAVLAGSLFAGLVVLARVLPPELCVLPAAAAWNALGAHWSLIYLRVRGRRRRRGRR